MPICKIITIVIAVLFSFTNYAQLIIPKEPTESSAELQVDSDDKAVLFPSHTTAEINSIVEPAHGLLIYNKTLNAFVYNIGTDALPKWQVIDNLIINTAFEIASIPTPTFGDIRYNSDTKSIFFYNGVSKLWEEICEDPQCQAFSVGSTIVKQADCFGVNNGEATIDITGGTAPFSYSWPDANTNSSRTDLLAGSYTITVTDSKGCIETTSLTITEPAQISATVSKINVNCKDSLNGQISINASGGNNVFEFSINNGSSWNNNSTFSSLNAGSYSIQIRDKIVPACVVSYGSNPVDISEPDILSMTASVTDANCYGTANGEIDLSPLGGSGGYEYSSNNGISWQASNSFSGLAATDYTVLVRDANATNCRQPYDSNPIAISQPTEMNISANKKDISINGGGDGTITVTASGSSGIFDYSIDGGLTWQASNSFISLESGDYNVMVRDQGTTSCEVSYASNPITIIEPGAINVSVTKTNVNCNGSDNGSIVITASSSPPLTCEYSIDNKATWVSGNIFTNLSPGSYNVWVRDQAIPTNEKEYNANPVLVTEPAALSVSITSIDADCYGDSNGQIEISANGGSLSYEYSNDNGSTWQASNIITGLDGGNYNIAVRDANATSCFLINPSNPIAVPDELIITESLTHILCNTANNGTKNNGAIDLVITGGNGGNTYNWSNGTGTGADNADGPNQTGLTAGMYSVTVTDAKGCLKNTSYTLTEPTAIALSNIIVADVSCHTNNSGIHNDGTITLTVAGGTGGLSYDWTDGTGTGSIDGNGANQIALQTGNYSVIISDANSCSIAASNINVGQASELIATVTAGYPVDVTCNGADDGEIRIEATGGTGSVFDVQIASHFAGYINNQSLPLLIDTLSPFSNKQLLVKDENECADVISSITVSEPAILSATNNVTPITCNGYADGAINVSVSGGNFPFSYSWNTGATSEDLSGLSGADYSVTITDAKNCTISLTNIAVSEPDPLSISSSITHVTCNGGSDGAVDVSVTGGNGTYTYLWNTGPISQDISSVLAGNYTITVTDTKGCTNNFLSTVTQPANLLVTHSITNTLSCFGDSDGAVTISPSGGTSPYSYDWPSGADVQSRSDLTADSYTVTVTDAHSCVKTEAITINTPTQITIAATTSAAACGASVGSANLDASGGTPFIGDTYEYSDDNTTWTPNVSTKLYENLVAGDYTYYVRDNNGCTISETVTVGGSSGISISFSSIVDVADCGQNNGSANVDVTGGTAFVDGFDFSWDGLATERELSGYQKDLNSGVHQVEVTDANGCSDTETLIINLPDITFSADGSGVAVIPNGNEAYWKLKRCGDIDVTDLSCSCDGVIYNWDITYDYFISATGEILLPISSGCTSVNSSAMFGHPDEGSFVDSDGDNVMDYNSLAPLSSEIDFRNARSDQYQFDIHGTDDVYDKDNLFVSPALKKTDINLRLAQYFDKNNTACTGGDCDVEYGATVAYCPKTTNESGDIADLYTADAVVEGAVMQQSMEEASTVCIDAYGAGWRLPTYQEVQYNYDVTGSVDPLFDPAYFNNQDEDATTYEIITSSKSGGDASQKLYYFYSKSRYTNETTVYKSDAAVNYGPNSIDVRCVFDTDLPVWQTNTECN